MFHNEANISLESLITCIHNSRHCLELSSEAVGRRSIPQAGTGRPSEQVKLGSRVVFPNRFPRRARPTASKATLRLPVDTTRFAHVRSVRFSPRDASGLLRPWPQTGPAFCQGCAAREQPRFERQDVTYVSAWCSGSATMVRTRSGMLAAASALGRFACVHH